MTTDPRFARLGELFEAASALPADERAAFVTRECADDPALADELLAVLAAGERAPALLDRPATETWPLEADDADDSPADDLLGATVDGWELIAVLGSGGMGSVYRARGPDGRELALKVIKRGMDSAEVLRRFANERVTLASLSHPHIVGLEGAGTVDDGRPYLLMELIDGRPIDRSCSERQLPLREVLGLFADVCDAVHHAHRNLIVHRDLKPANVLVRADGRPKLLDFGVAKLLASDGDSGTTTLAGQLVPLTPRYASPEQRSGGPITTATDVYALGVLLDELRAPFPVRPGSDLEVVAAMARHEDPERRHASAEQLAEDVRRYLGGLPVRARPDSGAYRVGKFVQRHAVGVGLAAIVLVALTATAVASTLGQRRARDAEGMAWRAHAQALQVATFYQGVLGAADESGLLDDPAVLEELDRAAAEVGTRLADYPEAEGRVRHALASLYARLERWEDALAQVDVSLELARSNRGFGKRDLSAMAELADRCRQALSNSSSGSPH